jgi:antirestriction protein ArdC
MTEARYVKKNLYSAIQSKISKALEYGSEDWCRRVGAAVTTPPVVSRGHTM